MISMSRFFFSCIAFREQLSSLEAVAQNIEDTYGFSVLLTVTDTTGDKTTYEYGEALYEANAAKEMRDAENGPAKAVEKWLKSL